MKLFKFSFGGDDRYVAFEDETDAYENRSTIDPMYEWTPVQIDEVTVEGYSISLTPTEGSDGEIAPRRRGRQKQGE